MIIKLKVKLSIILNFSFLAWIKFLHNFFEQVNGQPANSSDHQDFNEEREGYVRYIKVLLQDYY